MQGGAVMMEVGDDGNGAVGGDRGGMDEWMLRWWRACVWEGPSDCVGCVICGARHGM